ncbi:MAG: metallophosphoesterase [Polyangiaceae bacterium]|nr:metallophosphoesterase [Polyangiaceae bacterium]
MPSAHASPDYCPADAGVVVPRDAAADGETNSIDAAPDAGDGAPQDAAADATPDAGDGAAQDAAADATPDAGDGAPQDAADDALANPADAAPEADVVASQDAAADGEVNPVDGAPEADASSQRDIPKLVGAPLIFTPTAHGFGLNVVTTSRGAWVLKLCVRRDGSTEWRILGAPALPAEDIAQWIVEGLDAGTRYEYQVLAVRDREFEPLYSGWARTQRKPGERFSVALLTDSHIQPREDFLENPTPTGSMEPVLAEVAQDIGPSHPDFMIHLGDMLDFHAFGFNDPPPDGAPTRLGYLNYRRLLGDALGNAAHFAVIGNWEGENGDYTAEEIERSRSERLLYLPNPAPATYPEGGSPAQDYYAFTWGDALFVVLNVMSYTPTAHLLSSSPGLVDDWTLGEPQLAWLEDTLAAAASKWRFLFIHHTVGGAAGDYSNSAYGRGGGQAAYVGEQAAVHGLMVKYGVQIFFYGHDHVFTDMVVDGIHYTLPGSAGAPWKFTEYETGYTQYWSDSGHAQVDVSPTSVTVEFIAQGGEPLDSYTIE